MPLSRKIRRAFNSARVISLGPDKGMVGSSEAGRGGTLSVSARITSPISTEVEWRVVKSSHTGF